MENATTPTRTINARPAIERTPVHDQITSEQIDQLVEGFYVKARANDRLSPLFAQKIVGDWTPHLTKMKSFWRSVLLKTGEYKGKPIPAHTPIHSVESEDFAIWLNLFEETVREIFVDDAVEPIMGVAKKIARSLWLVMSGSIFEKEPDWLR